MTEEEIVALAASLSPSQRKPCVFFNKIKGFLEMVEPGSVLFWQQMESPCTAAKTQRCTLNIARALNSVDSARGSF